MGCYKTNNPPLEIEWCHLSFMFSFWVHEDGKANCKTLMFWTHERCQTEYFSMRGSVS